MSTSGYLPYWLNSSIEWYQNIPPAEHSYSELPLLTY